MLPILISLYLYIIETKIHSVSFYWTNLNSWSKNETTYKQTVYKQRITVRYWTAQDQTCGQKINSMAFVEHHHHFLINYIWKYHFLTMNQLKVENRFEIFRIKGIHPAWKHDSFRLNCLKTVQRNSMRWLRALSWGMQAKR